MSSQSETRRVVWLIRAQDALQNALCDAGLSQADCDARRARLHDMLLWTFPNAETIVVLERLASFSAREEKHVLRVEVHEAGRVLARVVKTARPDKLKKEIDGWQRCARPANDRGRAFMTLQPAEKVDGNYEMLIYEDAQQTLRAADLVSLEQAVLNCLRWNVPSVPSILAVLDQIFAEMVDRFYMRSRSVRFPTAAAAPAKQAAPAAPATLETGASAAAANLLATRLEKFRTDLEAGASCWRDAMSLPGTRRRDARGILSTGTPPVFDLMEFHRQIVANEKYWPELRLGPSHGDLHGRNVLVGLVDGEARWPAIFDYEDVAPDNLVCWDFVKLETELKIRGLQIIFPGEAMSFIKSVHRFEVALNEETERRNNRAFSAWHDTTEPTTEEDRLKAILLGIRRQARKCLDQLTGRGRRWLHEYYFFLACYAIDAGRFANYKQRDCFAAYISGSCAATRYHWGNVRRHFSASDAKRRADQALKRDTPDARLSIQDLFGYEACLAFASRMARSRKIKFVEQAVILLRELQGQHPGVVEIVQERVLALMELFDLTGDAAHRLSAYEVLDAFDCQTQGQYEFDSELICRWGRIWKDLGDRRSDKDVADAAAAAAGQQPAATAEPQCTATAKDYYQQALDIYLRAYEVNQDYYPGINVATLQLLLGHSKESEETATAVLETIQNRHAGAQSHWILATQGEARLLLGEAPLAFKSYQLALAHAECDAHACSAMEKQVQRILRKRPLPDGDQATLENLFKQHCPA